MRQVPRHCCVRPPDRLSRRSERDSDAQHDGPAQRSRRRSASTRTPTATTPRRSTTAGGCWGPSRSRCPRPAIASWWRGLRRFGVIDRVGVESTGSYAAGLTRHLRAEGVRVLEVNQPHAHTRRRRGKTDAIDAEMAARHVLEPRQPMVTPSDTTGIVESIRQLRVARDSAVKSRIAAMHAARRPDRHRAQRTARAARRAARRSRARPALCRRLRPDTRRLQRARSTPPSSRCAASRGASRSWTTRSPSSTRQLTPLVATAAPAHDGAARDRDRPRRRSCWSPPGRTSTASAAKARSPRSAAPARSPSPSGRTRPLPPQPRRRPPSQPRAAHDRRLSPALLPRDPRLRRSAAPPKARPRPRSSAASSATSPARPTPPSATTSDPSPPLDIYRNVPAWLIALGGHRGASISYVVREAGGLVAGPGEDDFVVKPRHGRAL